MIFETGTADMLYNKMKTEEDSTRLCTNLKENLTKGTHIVNRLKSRSKTI